MLDQINSILYNNLKQNKRENASSRIRWVKNIKDNHLNKFLLLHMGGFYPSIKENVFREALQLIKTHYVLNTHKKTKLSSIQDKPF